MVNKYSVKYPNNTFGGEDNTKVLIMYNAYTIGDDANTKTIYVY